MGRHTQMKIWIRGLVLLRLVLFVAADRSDSRGMSLPNYGPYNKLCYFLLMLFFKNESGPIGSNNQNLYYMGHIFIHRKFLCTLCIFSATKYLTIWLVVYVGIFAIVLNDQLEILILRSKSTNTDSRNTKPKEKNTIPNSHSDIIYDLWLDFVL